MFKNALYQVEVFFFHSFRFSIGIQQISKSLDTFLDGLLILSFYLVPDFLPTFCLTFVVFIAWWITWQLNHHILLEKRQTTLSFWKNRIEKYIEALEPFHKFDYIQHSMCSLFTHFEDLVLLFHPFLHFAPRYTFTTREYNKQLFS